MKKFRQQPLCEVSPGEVDATCVCHKTGKNLSKSVASAVTVTVTQGNGVSESVWYFAPEIKVGPQMQAKIRAAVDRAIAE